MLRLCAVATVLASAALSGCSSSSQSRSDNFEQSLGSSFQGGINRDTYGTNRRMDVYGGVTRPTLPTIGAPGFGK